MLYHIKWYATLSNLKVDNNYASRNMYSQQRIF